jgi:hypothetical protein
MCLVSVRASKAYERHVMLVGTTPLRETFPDHEKKEL